jgi:hypothetical protein
MLFKKKVRENKKEETEMTQKKGKRPYKKEELEGGKRTQLWPQVVMPLSVIRKPIILTESSKVNCP